MTEWLYIPFAILAVFFCLLWNAVCVDWGKLRDEAIRLGKAQYNPTTGKWEWKP